MDNRDQRSAISRIVDILRKITRIVQIIPFVYLLVYAVYLLVEFVLPDWALRISDTLFNVPLYATAGLLGAGRILKLCKWFRAACLLPVSAKVEGYIDSFVYTFTQMEVVYINIILGTLFIIFIAKAFGHFSNGRKAKSN